MRRLPFLYLLVGLLHACGGGQTKSEFSPRASDSATEPSGALAPKKLTEADLQAILIDVRDLVFNGQLQQAEDVLEKALLNDVSGDFIYQARFNLGVLCERRGAYTEAMRHFEMAQRLKPSSGPAVLARARLYVRQNRATEALDLVRRALEEQPQSVPIQNALNRILVDANQDLDTVIKSSKRILVQDENNAEAMMNMAIAYQHQGRHDMAIDVLNRAEADFPTMRSDLMWRKARSFLALEQTLNARRVLTEATESPSTATPELHNMLGLMDLEAGNPDSAEGHFRKALVYSPNMIAACVNLSHALKAGQKYDEALSTLNECSDRSGGEVDMLYNLGILYLDGKFSRIKGLKQVERAKSYFEDFLAKASDDERKKLATTYLGESEKRIKYEKKKLELKERARKREAARKAREAEEAQMAPDEADAETDDSDETGSDADDGEMDGE